ncbi:MAG TPA: kelch repeat-containing protein [Pilimelia sp.]|nr:kelch repeat-containing protein [Pilimelia sp.]
MTALLVGCVTIGGCTAPPVRPAPSPGTTPPVRSPASVPAGPSPFALAEPTMILARAAHTATLLPDGRALIAGGCAIDGCEGMRLAAQSEFYSPSARRFLAGPVMTAPRAGHTATPLLDGRVLLTGGYGAEGQAPWPTAEIFDPRRGVFAPTGPMGVRRGAHTATRLRDGRVLVVGGSDGGAALTSVEVFDPETGRFTPAASLPGPRATHGAALLADGRVLVAGGQSGVGHGVALLDTAAVYDPAADAWREVDRLVVPKYKLAIAALPGGGALVIGGQTADAAGARLSTTETFDPRSGRFAAGSSMAEPRYKISDAVAALPDGRIAVAGGYGLEVYAVGRFRQAALGEVERQSPALVVLADGTALVTGGYDDRTRVTATAYLADTT